MTELATIEFDYSDCTRAARKRLERTASEVRSVARHAVLHVGRQLNEVKKYLEHGEFERWVDSECGLDARRAREMMRAADVFKTAQCADLDISKRALFDLSAKNCPQEATLEAIERAEGGERITYTLARELIAKHKPKPVEQTLLPAEASGATPGEQDHEAVQEDVGKADAEAQPLEGDLLDDGGDEVEYEDVEDSDLPCIPSRDWLDDAGSALFVARSSNQLAGLFKWLFDSLDASERALVDAVIGQPSLPYDESVPEELNSDAFQEAWETWKQHRKEDGKKLKPTTAKLQLKKLQRMGVERAVRALIYSATNGWTGIFEEDEKKPAPATQDETRAVLDAYEQARQ